MESLNHKVAVLMIHATAAPVEREDRSGQISQASVGSGWKSEVDLFARRKSRCPRCLKHRECACCCERVLTKDGALTHQRGLQMVAGCSCNAAGGREGAGRRIEAVERHWVRKTIPGSDFGMWIVEKAMKSQLAHGIRSIETTHACEMEASMTPSRFRRSGPE